MMKPIHFGKFVESVPGEEFRKGDAFICSYEDSEGRQYMVDHGLTITNFDAVIVGM